MPRQSLRIGGYRYEHTEPLFDGRVSIEGVDAVFESSQLLSDVFFKMAKGEYDVAEFGLTYFLRTFDTKDSPFLALPIFPNRNFGQSVIFINTDSGIEKPEHLGPRSPASCTFPTTPCGLICATCTKSSARTRAPTPSPALGPSGCWHPPRTNARRRLPADLARPNSRSRTSPQSHRLCDASSPRPAAACFPRGKPCRWR